MDDVIYGLNEEDRNSLQDFMAKVDRLSLVVNSMNRGNSRQEDDPPAPEVYVAVIPEEGIDALDPFGSTAIGVPDSADCQIYSLQQDPVTDIKQLLPIGEDVTRTVYNLGSNALDGGTWCLVARDKAGSWYATTGSGGGSVTNGDEIRKVVPTLALGPSPGSGSGSEDGNTFLWLGDLVDISYAKSPAPPLGTVTPFSIPVYLIQRTISTAPEPYRELAIGGVYLGDFLGISSLDPDIGFRRVYAVVGAPGLLTEEVTLIKSIDSATGVCNGGTPPTVTVTINFTPITVKVLR